jgi:hypothetical protein
VGVSLTTPPRRADSSSHGQNPGHAASSALCQLSFYCLWYEYVIETLSQHLQQIDLKQILERGGVTDGLAQLLRPVVTRRPRG